MSKSKLYHAINPTFTTNLSPEREDYKLVAEIDSTSLDQIYAMTQNILGNECWAINPLINAFGEKTIRSTSVGDVINVDGKLFVVDMIDFMKITDEAVLEWNQSKKMMKLKLIATESNTRTAEEIVDDIASHLRECDGEFIAEIANKVLDMKVKYIEDSFFEVE